MAVPLFVQPLVKYADFQGRARRAEYWQWVLLTLCVSGAFCALQTYAPQTYSHSYPHFPAYSHFSATLQIASAIWSFGTLIPGMAVTVRRFHDSNRTGWWMAYICIAPAACVHLSIAYYFLQAKFKIQEVHSAPVSPLTHALPFDPAMVGVGAFLALVCLFPVIFLMLDGTPRNNRFGPDPKGRGATSTPF